MHLPGHSLTYDVRRQRVVLTGGRIDSMDGTTTFKDTWEWNGTAWTQRVTSPGPPLTKDSAFAYDTTLGRAVLFAGNAGSSSLSETWEWDGTRWSNATPVTSPPPREGQAVAYDEARHEVVLFGGDGLNDTWVFRHGQPATHDESCLYGFDGDSDGVVGCADPDCFGYCSPLCNPAQMTCSIGPRCGDGTCQPIETARLCPADCGAPTRLCGDSLCESPETMLSCPGDCP